MATVNATLMFLQKILDQKNSVHFHDNHYIHHHLTGLNSTDLKNLFKEFTNLDSISSAIEGIVSVCMANYGVEHPNGDKELFFVDFDLIRN